MSNCRYKLMKQTYQLEDGFNQKTPYYHLGPVPSGGNKARYIYTIPPPLDYETPQKINLKYFPWYGAQ